nr:hypothetical protein [Tanacetum cinerariifolium]
TSGRTLYELGEALLYDVGSAGYAYPFYDARKINRDDLMTYEAGAFGVRARSGPRGWQSSRGRSCLGHREECIVFDNISKLDHLTGPATTTFGHPPPEKFSDEIFSANPKNYSSSPDLFNLPPPSPPLPRHPHHTPWQPAPPHHRNYYTRHLHNPIITTPLDTTNTTATPTAATAAAFPAAAAAVVGLGMSAAKNHQVVAVGRRYSHHSRTMWCQAVAAQPLRVPRCAQPFDATAVEATEPAVVTTATTAAPWWCQDSGGDSSIVKLLL